MIFKDQLNRDVNLKTVPPKTIVSLVPSQTELLFDLGLDKEIAAVTWFCVHPNDKVKDKIKIGGTKNFKTDKIIRLKPDLIIANKEENDKEAINILSKQFPVWISDVKDMVSALNMIRSLGEIFNKKTESQLIASDIEINFSELERYKKPLNVLYLIWRDPYITVGNDTFIDSMLNLCGFKNVCSNKSRYPEVSLNEINDLKPDLIILSSEPYPFKNKHVEELKKAYPASKVTLANGEMFSWYGSRLLKAADYLKVFLKSL